MAAVRTVGSLAALVLLLASAAAAADTGRLVSDGALRVPLRSGWFGSVGPGLEGTHPVAWILVANFRLPADAARHEGIPRVPRGKVVVAIGDFFPDGASAHWRVVDNLRVPRAQLVRSGRWWRVRYAGRAVTISATFGSRPRPALLSRTEQVLAAIRS
jgi:hypothetical protein